MLTWLYPVFAFVVGTVVTAAYCWFIHPGILIRGLIRYGFVRYGMSIKYIKAGRYRFCYAEKGKANKNHLTMLFVHGFSASKDMWLPCVGKLPPNLHVILMDLPGHGNTTIPSETDDISVHQLANDLHDFVLATGLKNHGFHLLGTSLGGAVAALYTAIYPDGVEKLSLICPAMESPIRTKFLQEIEDGECRLIPNTPQELRYMLDSCWYHKPKIYPQLLKGLLQLRLPKNHFYTRLFEQLRKEQKGAHDEMSEKLGQIKPPTQVVWGQNDELIHVSGVEVLKEKLPNLQQLNVFDKCGHSVQMDCPGRLVKSVLEFRGELHLATNQKYSNTGQKKLE